MQNEIATSPDRESADAKAPSSDFVGLCNYSFGTVRREFVE